MEFKFPITGIVAIVFLVIGGILHIIGLASPYWHEQITHYSSGGITVNTGHSGLWTECMSVNNYLHCTALSSVTGWLQAVRAMAVIGLMFGSGALIMTGLYMFTNLEKFKGMIKVSAIATCFTAGVFVMIGVIIYGVKVTERQRENPYYIGPIMYNQLSWGFGLSCAASGLCVIAGVLVAFSKK